MISKALLCICLALYGTSLEVAGIKVYVPEGYSHVGHVSAMVRGKFPGKPRNTADMTARAYASDEILHGRGSFAADQHAAQPDIQHASVLFTNDGHVYEKPLSAKPVSRPYAPKPRKLGENFAHFNNDRIIGTSLDDLDMASKLYDDSNHVDDMRCEGCPATDIRTRVNDTSLHPFRSVGMLTKMQRGALSGSLAQCTATLISPHHLVTAAHCVVSSETWQPVTSIEWWPSLNGLDGSISVFPDGTTHNGSALPVAHIRVVRRYLDLGEDSVTALNYDFALVTLANRVPDRYIPLNISGGNWQAHYDLRTAGYPGDKPDATMWTVDCQNVFFDFIGSVLACGECDNVVIHTCLSREGQSGSSMWQINPSTGNVTQIRAILTGVIFLESGKSLNTATEMNTFVYNALAEWANEDDGNTTFVLAPRGEGPNTMVTLPGPILGFIDIPGLSIQVPLKTIFAVLLSLLIIGAVVLIVLQVRQWRKRDTTGMHQYSNFS